MTHTHTHKLKIKISTRKKGKTLVVAGILLAAEATLETKGPRRATCTSDKDSVHWAPTTTLTPCGDLLSPPQSQMTGRKGRVVSRPDGSVVFESRAEQGLSIDHVNLREKQRFMSGEKVGPGACVGQLGAGGGERVCLHA